MQPDPVQDSGRLVFMSSGHVLPVGDRNSHVADLRTNVGGREETASHEPSILAVRRLGECGFYQHC